MDSPSRDKVQDLLQSFHTAMLVTHSGHGAMHARPMEIAQAGPDCHVWFFTDGTTGKAREIREDEEVLLTFQKDHQKYLTITGVAKLVTDRSMMQALWKEPYRVWFPGGVEDPSLMLLHVVPREAEYWDNSGLKGVRYLYEAAMAYVTKSTPEVEEGTLHGHVTLT